MKKKLFLLTAVLTLIPCLALAGWNYCEVAAFGVTGNRHRMAVQGCQGADHIADSSWFLLWEPFEAQQAEVVSQAYLASRRISFHLVVNSSNEEPTTSPYINAVYMVP